MQPTVSFGYGAAGVLGGYNSPGSGDSFLSVFCHPLCRGKVIRRQFFLVAYEGALSKELPENSVANEGVPSKEMPENSVANEGALSKELPENSVCMCLHIPKLLSRQSI